MIKGKSVHEIRIGEEASFSKTISESDVYLYAGITGDLNPIHVNREYAAQTTFKKPIAHGPLTAGLVASILGTQLPGLGTVLVELNTKYLAPVYFGDTITVNVRVTSKNEEKNKATLVCEWINQEQKRVIQGEVVVSPPNK